MYLTLNKSQINILPGNTEILLHPSYNLHYDSAVIYLSICNGWTDFMLIFLYILIVQQNTDRLTIQALLIRDAKNLQTKSKSRNLLPYVVFVFQKNKVQTTEELHSLHSIKRCSSISSSV